MTTQPPKSLGEARDEAFESLATDKLDLENSDDGINLIDFANWARQYGWNACLAELTSSAKPVQRYRISSTEDTVWPSKDGKWVRHDDHLRAVSQMATRWISADEIYRREKVDERIQQLESQLQIAVEGLKFYADKNKWADRWIEDDEGNGGDIFDVIDRDDVKIETSDDGEHYLTYGGECARDALDKIKAKGGV